MTAAFAAGILLGIIVVLGAARFYPWVDHPRSASRTTVLHNGGRVEDFLIRFPVDRISNAGTAQMGLRARAFPADVELPEEFAAKYGGTGTIDWSRVVWNEDWNVDGMPAGEFAHWIASLGTDYGITISVAAL